MDELPERRPPTPLGRRLLDLIRLHNTTMHRVSEDAGLSPSTVRQWIWEPKLAGQPRPENLLAVAKVLGASYAELLQLAGHPLPPETRAEPAQLRKLVDRIHELEKMSPERAAFVVELALYLAELESDIDEPLIDEESNTDDTGNILQDDCNPISVGRDGIGGPDRPAGKRDTDPAARTRRAARMAVRARLMGQM